MDSSRRWLTIFAIVIGVLVIATVALVLFTTQKEIALLPVDTPQGTVQRFLLAVQDKDYLKAYNYLSYDPTGKTVTYNDWIMGVSSSQSAWKATLGKVTENDGNATVEVTVDTFNSSGPFGDSMYSQQITFQLIQKGGSWFIVSPTYLYWIY